MAIKHWEVILRQMYRKRVKIMEKTEQLPPYPTRYRVAGNSIHSSTVRALESRGYITRRRNSKFEIQWHLTKMGRRSAAAQQKKAKTK